MKRSVEVFLHQLTTALCSYCQRPHFPEKESQSPYFVLVHSCLTTYSSLGEENCKKQKWAGKSNKLRVTNLPQFFCFCFVLLFKLFLSNILDAFSMVGCPLRTPHAGTAQKPQLVSSTTSGEQFSSKMVSSLLEQFKKLLPWTVLLLTM